MADEPKLIVAVEARLDRFERQLKQAGLIAERELKELESKTQFSIGGIAAGNLLAIGIEKAMKGAIDAITEAVDKMNKLNDVIVLTGISAENLQRVGFATRGAGLSDATMVAGLESIATKMNEINHGETELSKFLDKNNVKYRERNGLVIDANKALDLAAALMERAGNELDKVKIAEKFGLTKEWAKAIGESVEKWQGMKAAANVNPELERSLKHLEEINKLVALLRANFTGWGTSLTTSVLPALDVIATQLAIFTAALAKPFEGGWAGEKFVNDLAARMKTASESIKAALAEANTPRIRVEGKGTIKGLGADAAEKERDAIDKAVDALKKRNELAEAELATIGLTVQKQEEARQMALLRAAAEREGKNLQEAMTAEMVKQVARAGELQQKTAENNAKWAEMVSASRELGSIMSDAMKGLVLEGKKFDEVLKNIGNRIASKAFDKLFDIMFAAPAGGGGSAFMNLFNLGGARMAGGPVRGGSAYMVGERGPEMFVPNRSGMVVPNTALANGGGGVTIGSPTTNVVVQGSADRETLGLKQQMLAARDRRFVADVAHATSELRRRSAFA